MATKYNKADRPEITPDEMYAIAKNVCDLTFSDPVLVEKMKKSKLILRFQYHDVERWGDTMPEITIDFNADPIDLNIGPCDLVPIIDMNMEAFTAHLFWMEKLNLMSAITRGQIKAKGPIPKAMRLLPMLKPFYKNYRIVLKDMGRDDLLNFPPD
jgi:hypothetical protein